MWDGHMGDFGWWAAWMFFGMVLFWAIIATAAVLIVRSLGGRDTGESRGQALAILEERYARGEIDDEQFERMRERLSRGRGRGDT